MQCPPPAHRPAYLPAHRRLRPMVNPNPEQLQIFLYGATQRNAHTKCQMQNAHCERPKCKMQNAKCTLQNAKCTFSRFQILSFGFPNPHVWVGLVWLSSVWLCFRFGFPFDLLGEERVVASENDVCAAFCNAKIPGLICDSLSSVRRMKIQDRVQGGLTSTPEQKFQVRITLCCKKKASHSCFSKTLNRPITVMQASKSP